MFSKRFKNLKWFRPYYKKYIKLIIVLLFVMIISSSAGILLAWLMSEQLVAITDMITCEIVKYTILILLGVLIHHICWYFWATLHSKIGNKIALDIKSNIYNNFLHTKYSYIKNKTSGYYLERLSDDIESVSNFFGDVAGTMVDVFTNCSFLILIYFFNWQCGLFLTIGVLFLFIVDSIRIKIEVQNLKEIKVITEQSSSKFVESLKGIKEIKGLGIENEVLESYKIIETKLHNKQHSRDVIDELLKRIKTFLQYVIDAGLVLMSAFWLFPTGQISVVVLLIIFNYKGLLYETVGYFSEIKSRYVQGDYRAGRILELLNSEREVFGSQKTITTKANIEIKNLTYTYDNKKIILNNLNFSIKENTCSVFIGSSGSGKSTLFNVLTKLLHVENGKVFYGGIDINDFDLDTLRKTICIVGQDSFLFNDTIVNNLKLANKNVTQEEIEKACEKANIHNEILNMPNGYNTVILENATNISGGQKQRLSIARALLKNTPIILFDEPTSSLDKNNQEKFFDVLKNLKENKTICVIAHKLDNYSLFDNVFELKR